MKILVLFSLSLLVTTCATLPVPSVTFRERVGEGKVIVGADGNTYTIGYTRKLPSQPLSK